MSGGRRCCLLAALIAGCGWAAAPSSAATVAVVGDRLLVSDGSGEANDLVVTREGERYLVSDGAVAPTPADASCGPGDTPVVVVCPAAGVVVLEVVAGDGDDRVEVRAATPARLEGGTGSDALLGGPSDDVLVGGPGADLTAGSGGSDSVRYDDGLHDGGVVVSLSGGANDGSPGEGDDVREVELLEGTSGSDFVLGTDGPETFNGGAGDDVAELLGGDDVFLGGEGDDMCVLETGDDVCDGGAGLADLAAYRTSAPLRVTLDGRPDDGPVGATGNVVGVEEVVGGEGPDLIVGGPANEELSGRGGDDTILGGPGDDLIAGDRGADVLGGGDGRDRVAYSTVFVAAPVRVTVDDSSGDGVPGEQDRVGRDVETIEGTTTAADVLVAGDRPTELRGLGGDDRLAGGSAADVLDAGPGADLVSSLDGVRDEVRCGSGPDAVVADAIDVLRNCEARLRERPGYERPRSTRARPVLVLVWACPRAFRSPVPPRRARCRGTTSLRLPSGVTLARARIDVPSGERRRVRLRLTATTRRRVQGALRTRLVTKLPGVPTAETSRDIVLRRG